MSQEDHTVAQIEMINSLSAALRALRRLGCVFADDPALGLTAYQRAAFQATVGPWRQVASTAIEEILSALAAHGHDAAYTAMLSHGWRSAPRGRS